MRASLALVCVLAALLLATPAYAHGYIVRALPEDRAALERAPARLQYWFSESLEPAFSTLALRDRAGQLLATGEVDPDNHLRMSLTVPADLADGAYLVDLRPAFASDGHVVAETRVFFVGQAADAAVSGSSGYALEPLEVLWRTLLYAACLLLFGAHVLYSAVLLPAWGRSRHRAGGLPPRLMRRLGQIALAALAVAFGANLLAMLQQTMVFFAADAARVLEQGLWQVVRVGSRFGDVWTLRLLLLAFCALLSCAGPPLAQPSPGTGGGLLVSQSLGDGAAAGQLQREQPRRRVAALSLAGAAGGLVAHPGRGRLEWRPGRACAALATGAGAVDSP